MSPTAQALDSTELAAEIGRFALEKKAHDVIELDMRGLVGYTDWFVICSGNTDRQVKAIHDAIHAGVKQEHGVSPRRVEGAGRAQWVLMDYLDVVVHIFTPATREFYRLEQLWGEAPMRTVGEEWAEDAAGVEDVEDVEGTEDGESAEDAEDEAS